MEKEDEVGPLTVINLESEEEEMNSSEEETQAYWNSVDTDYVSVE